MGSESVTAIKVKLKVVDTFISKFRHLGPFPFTKVNITNDIKISLYDTPILRRPHKFAPSSTYNLILLSNVK